MVWDSVWQVPWNSSEILSAGYWTHGIEHDSFHTLYTLMKSGFALESRSASQPQADLERRASNRMDSWAFVLIRLQSLWYGAGTCHLGFYSWDVDTMICLEMLYPHQQFQQRGYQKPCTLYFSTPQPYQVPLLKPEWPISNACAGIWLKRSAAIDG